MLKTAQQLRPKRGLQKGTACCLETWNLEKEEKSGSPESSSSREQQQAAGSSRQRVVQKSGVWGCVVCDSELEACFGSDDDDDPWDPIGSGIQFPI